MSKKPSWLLIVLLALFFKYPSFNFVLEFRLDF
jgi:hypothetical protein